MANAVTIFRLLLIPVFIYLFFSSDIYPNYIALFVFLTAALTDWLDGFIARKRKEVTDFGKILDPLVDRALVITVIIALVLKNKLPLSGGLAIIIRDVIMVVGYKAVEVLKNVKIEVEYFGKFTTAAIFVSLSIIMLDMPFGLYVFWITVGLHLASGLNYIFKSLKVLRK